jgi:MFS family permease
VIGPALAGLLITTTGYGWAFAVDGISYVAVIVAYLRMRPDQLRPAPVTLRAKHQVRDGLRYVRRTPELFVPLVMMAVVGTLAFNFQVVFPLLVTRTFHGSEGTFTILFSVISVGSLVGALLTARRRSIGVEHVVASSGLFGLSMLLFAVTPSIGFAYPLGMIVGASSIGFLTASTAIVQMKATPEMRGRVLALQAIVFLGSTPVGGPILGWISDTWGPRTGVLLGGAAACGAAIWGFAASRRLHLARHDAGRADTTGLPLPEPVA